MSQATSTVDEMGIDEQREEDEDPTPEPPESIQGRNLTARVLRQKIWRSTNVNNDWFMAVLVGREGSGKSHTALSICERCDPTFTAERVHFEPDSLLEQINDIDPEDRQGKAVMLDESGVGMGVRSWYDQGQIAFNKTLQTARDDNMIVLSTLPRLSELDSQMRGRLHAFLEMSGLEPGRYAKFRWKNVDPCRDERDKIYKKYPRLRVNGRTRKVRELGLGPPSEELADAYEEKKEQFKKELYEETVETIRDEEGGADDASPKEIYEEIKEEREIEDFLSLHGAHKNHYIDGDLIQVEYDISRRDAKQVKKLLQKDEEVVINE